MNISKIIGPKTALSAVIVSTLAINSCNKSISKENNTQTNVVDKFDSIDTTKPNLPLIDGNKISYKRLNGEYVTLKIESYPSLKDIAAASLYKTISKMSTQQQPNIEDVEGFYVEFERNNDKSNGINEARLPQIQASMMFDNLFRLFTAPDSDRGKTITVKEYTQMMDAWSSFSTKE